MENRGVIGVFVGEVNGATICSVSVRAEQSREELEEQVRREHSVYFPLRRMYALSCKGNVVDVETSLRKILCLKFGPYTPPHDGWEGYTVENVGEFMEFIKTIVCLINSITVVREIQ